MKIFAILIPIFLITIPLRGQSDPQAIELADKVMEAIGGEDNWDQTRYLRWNFFGRRLWYWDKMSGNVRCEIQSQGIRIAMNIHDKSGKVFAHDIVLTDPDSLSQFLNMGYQMWVNDSYWLAMPFKLQDPGTTVKYLRTRPNSEDILCEVLELTFHDVGVTPDNKYHIYVDPDSYRIVQWDYFKKYSDTDPRMSTPWTGYKNYDKILLSDGRGDRVLSDIAVFRNLPDKVFSDVREDASELIGKEHD